jgi:hypothetical protein
MTLFVVLGILVFLYVLPLLLGLLVLRFGPTHKVPKLATVDPSWLDASWVARARVPVDQLTERGFVLRGYVDGMALRNAPTGIRCAALLTNDATGDLAQIAVADQLGDGGRPQMVTITMLSRNAGAKRVATMNGDMPSFFIRPSAHIGTALPMLHNAATLHDAHVALCAKHLGKSTRGKLPPAGAEVSHLLREAAEEFAYQANRGLMRPSGEGSYAMTWRGALRGVRKLHPRFMAGHRRRTHETGIRLLGELGITPDPAPIDATQDAGTPDLSPEMQAFVDSACQESDAATTRLLAEWQLGQSTGFDADMTTGVVRFHFPDGRLLLADFQIIGTWAGRSSWEWAWNNPNVAAAVKPDADRIREFGEKSGIGYLSNGFAVAPTIEIAAYFAALGTKVIDAGPVIPLPPDASAEVVAFVALRNMRAVKPNAA